MTRKITAALLGVMHALNGLMMLLAGQRWYQMVPGVTHTGPFNPHFVADIGAAYLAAGMALAARAWRVDYWPAAVAGAGFLGLHAVIHLFDFVSGPDQDKSALVLVVLPALLAGWAALPEKGERHV